MGPLARIEPVARPLLRLVDAALATLGAPADHPVWPALRRVRATPVDAVAFFAAIDPERIRAIATPVRREIDAYRGAVVPVAIAWEGGVANLYAQRAAALNRHLCGDHSDALTTRLAATADYAEEVAEWYARSQRAMAGTLADVIASPQAVTIAGRGIDPSDADAVRAAADIGARVLETAAEALDEGHDLEARWRPQLAESTFAASDDGGPIQVDAAIRLSR